MVDAAVQKMLGGWFDDWVLMLCGSCRLDCGNFGGPTLVWGVEGEVAPMMMSGYKEE